MLQERLSQVGTKPNAAGRFSHLPTNCLEILTNELGHVRSRQMAPEVLHWVEFRRVRRQILVCEPRLFRDPGLNLFAAMCWQSVPQQDDGSSAHVLLECLQISHDLRLLNCARLKPQTQPDTSSGGRGDQTGDGRQTLPVEGRDQDRSLTTRGPGPSHTRAFRESTFVQENQ